MHINNCLSVVLYGCDTCLLTDEYKFHISEVIRKIFGAKGYYSGRE
jgi:hypothetical protein